MADVVPVSEVRRVVIQYEIQVPRMPTRPTPRAPEPSAMSDHDLRALTEKIRRELLRDATRNGGRTGF